MYSFPLALVVVAVVSTAGACLNYELSALLARDMIIDLVPARISVFHHSVQKHQDHLLNYFVFLRVRSNFQDAYLETWPSGGCVQVQLFSSTVNFQAT